MFFSDKSELETLDFSPNNHHLTLARVEWKGVVLNQAAQESSPLVDLSEFDLSQCLFDLFGPLNIVEISELFNACEKHPTLKASLDKNVFVKLQGRQWNERLSDLMAQLGNAPQSFRDWARTKQTGIKDLQPLLSIDSMADFAPLLSSMAERNFSRNEGKQILDLLVDLFLLEKPISELLPPEKGDWLSTLILLRNPMTMGNKVSSQSPSSWPKFVQVVNHRQGYRVLNKMQIIFSDSQDLNDKLKRLSSKEPLA